MSNLCKNVNGTANYMPRNDKKVTFAPEARDVSLRNHTTKVTFDKNAIQSPMAAKK